MQLNNARVGMTALQTADPLIEIGDDIPCLGSGLTAVFDKCVLTLRSMNNGAALAILLVPPLLLKSTEAKSDPPFMNFASNVSMTALTITGRRSLPKTLPHPSNRATPFS